MKETERQVMCVLLQALLDKNLITQDISDKAKTKILGTLDEAKEKMLNAVKSVMCK